MRAADLSLTEVMMVQLAVAKGGMVPVAYMAARYPDAVVSLTASGLFVLVDGADGPVLVLTDLGREVAAELGPLR